MAKGRKNKKSGESNIQSNWVDKHELAIMATLMIVSLVVIIIIVAPGLLWTGTSQNTNAVTQNALVTPSVNSVNNASINVSSCLAGYGISEGSTIYVYSDSCSAAQANTPWVEDLKSKGDNIYFANTNNANAMAALASCMPGVDISGTPEFICSLNGNNELGSFNSEADLSNFIASCK